MRPNLFDYATSELSQDAFLAWFCRWADESMTDDKELKASARAFLKKYIAIQQPDFEDEIRKVEVKRQFEHIDVLLTINNNLSVIIEDKVLTSAHGNQLSRYSNAIKEDRKVKLYIKTGDESQSQKMRIESEGYVVITRADLLQSLENCKSKNEILRSFVERLRRWEDATLSYRQSDVWSTAQLIGFYKDMERVLPGSQWTYVSNPNKGNHVFNWMWVELPDCKMYLEFSFPQWCAAKQEPYLVHFKLLVKITALNEPRYDGPQKVLRRELLHKHSRAFIAHANGLVYRPHVLRPGRYMTIAEVGFEHFAQDSASIDVMKIAELLHSYEKAVKMYAESENKC
ncbi:MAG: PD-(D/E)XK nuclease family protein [Paludibacteraceae bacterium]|nr:PD-(D/E)XK nuclease family protein [Paludibacteraceae bacterium]MBQ6984003.1 PD-(D/E)XK nuclease family protein [Paludibacteraceae bacterium]